MNFISETIHVRFTLTEDMLGMSASKPNIHEEFIASKAPDALSREEEVAALGVESVVENAMTVFPKTEDGVPFLWDYQIKGFLKDSMKMLKKTPKTACGQIKAYKQAIDGNIFVVDENGDPQRRILIDMHGGEIGSCQRPLRAETAQGPRVALANSESVPAGSTFEVRFGLMDPGLKKAVIECCEYAKYHGFGQWRNSGKGCATYERMDEEA